MPQDLSQTDRYSKRPDPTVAASAAEFMQLLRTLRVWAGNPSLAVLAKRTGVGRTTLHDCLTGKRTGLPPLDTLRRLVSACGCPPEEVTKWTVAWRRLQDHPGPAAAASAPSAPVQVPRQLPAPGMWFVGREGELKQLDTMLEAWLENPPGSAGVAVICGPGGMGKTAMAVRWAQQKAEVFPDGQLYLNLDGFSSRPQVTVEQALTTLLRGLNVPSQHIPTDVQAQGALYRSILSHQRMLIVLDNAADAAQVRPLLPGGQSCLAVVTSRQMLSGLVAREGASRLVLSGLDDAEAMQLLSLGLGPERVMQDERGASRLARLCGYLPLALRVAAANLVDHPHRTINGYADELEGGDRLGALSVEDDSETAVRAVFATSYDRLSPASQRLFRLLGLLPGTNFSVDTAAALLGSGREQALAELQVLAASHLIEVAGPNRFALHDLLMVFAQSLAAEHEPAAAQIRENLLQWYLDTAINAVEIIRPNLIRLPAHSHPGVPALTFADTASARQWLDVELANLVEAVRTAGATQGLRHYTWLLADALRGYFTLRVPKAEWFTAATTGLEAAQQAEDPAAEAAMWACLGDAAWADNDFAGAISHFRLALQQSLLTGDRRRAAAVMSNLGLTAFEIGDLILADEWLTKAVTAYGELGDKARQATGLARLGSLQRDLGKLEAAKQHLQQAIAWHQQTGNDYQYADAVARLGSVLRFQGHLPEAIECVQTAHDIYARVGDRPGVASMLEDLAAMYVESGEPKRALELCATAMPIVRDLGDLRVESDVCGTQGAAMHLTGAEGAEEQVLQGLRIARNEGYKRSEINALIALADICRGKGATAQAKQHAAQALQVSRTAQLRLLEARSLTTLAWAQLADGNTAEAASTGREALALHTETGQQLGQARATELLAHTDPS